MPEYIKSGDGDAPLMPHEERRGVRVAKRFDDATTRTGRRLESMGRSARDRMHSAGETLAERAESFGVYLQDHDAAKMAEDVAGVVRRYPVQSMLVGVGARHGLTVAV